MCVCVCMYIYTYIHTYIHICIYIYTYTHTHIYIYRERERETRIQYTAWKPKDTHIMEYVISKTILDYRQLTFQNRKYLSRALRWNICFHVTNILSPEKSIPSRHIHKLVNVKDECKRRGFSALPLLVCISAVLWTHSYFQ